MAKMKNGKAVGPDDIPVNAWRYLENSAVDFLPRLFDQFLQKDR